MPDLATIDLTADRGLFFVQPLVFLREDFTGADFDLHIRERPDAPGPPLIDLDIVADDSEGVRLMYAGTDTIANHITAGRLDASIYTLTNPLTGSLYASGTSLLLSHVRLLALMDGRIPIPGNSGFPGERGDNAVLAYDFIVTKSGSIAAKYARGAFIVRGTVTQ